MKDWLPLPVDGMIAQSASVHFFAQALGILLHAFSSESIMSACFFVQLNLLPDILIERLKARIFRL